MKALIDAAFAKFAARVHRLWRLECCTAEDIIPWLSELRTESQLAGNKKFRLQRFTFCDDCEPSWRAEREAEGACVVARQLAVRRRERKVAY